MNKLKKLVGEAIKKHITEQPDISQKEPTGPFWIRIDAFPNKYVITKTKKHGGPEEKIEIPSGGGNRGKVLYQVKKWLEWGGGWTYGEASTAGGIIGHQSQIPSEDTKKIKKLAKEVYGCMTKMIKEGVIKESREYIVSPKTDMYGIPLSAYLTFAAEPGAKGINFYLSGADTSFIGHGTEVEDRKESIKIFQEILQLLEDVGTLKSAVGMWDIKKREAEQKGLVSLDDLGLKVDVLVDLLNRAGFLTRPDTEEERTNFMLKHGEIPSDEEEYKQGLQGLGQQSVSLGKKMK